MKFFYEKYSKTDGIWRPVHILISQKIRNKEPITEADVSPRNALSYITIKGERVPELELLLLKSNSGIRTEYLKLLELIKH
jgi:hypothetical protein